MRFEKAASANDKWQRSGDINLRQLTSVVTYAHRSTDIGNVLPVAIVSCAHLLVIFRFGLPTSKLALTKQSANLDLHTMVRRLRAWRAYITLGLHMMVCQHQTRSARITFGLLKRSFGIGYGISTSSLAYTCRSVNVDHVLKISSVVYEHQSVEDWLGLPPSFIAYTHQSADIRCTVPHRL